MSVEEWLHGSCDGQRDMQLRLVCLRVEHTQGQFRAATFPHINRMVCLVDVAVVIHTQRWVMRHATKAEISKNNGALWGIPE